MFRLLFLMFTLTVTYVKSQYASPCLTTNQQPGLCMPVKSCKPIYDFFISHSDGIISEQDRLRLASMHCGTFKNVKHVCCRETDIQLNIDGLNILKKNTCGAYFVNSIANGEKASLFQYPWMVLLKYNDNRDPFKCGGTLINDQYVLTAAHCIKGNEHKLKQVRLGEYQISTTIDCTNVSRKNQCAPPVEDVGIEEMIMHEQFHRIYNDIALIRLNRKVEFKQHIKPICLPINDYLRSKEPDNFVIAGWGKTENGTYSDVLLTAFVPRVNRSGCENHFHNYRLPLNDGHICAGGSNLVDTCRGDSGGPLGYRDMYDNRPRFIQFGIVSYGLYKCGVEPGVYTNISHYMQWITDNLKETSGKTSNQEPQSCITPAMENGFCVPYNECPYANNLVKLYGSFDAIPKNDINVLINSKCSGDNEPTRLCCEMLNNTIMLQNKPLKANPAKPDSTLTEDLDYNRDINSQFNSHEAQSCITPAMENGFCVPYNECPYANNLVKRYGSFDAIPKNDLNVLIKSKCSRDNEPIRLCCKLSNNYVPQNIQSKAIPKPDPTLTEYLDYNRNINSQFNSHEALSCITPAMETGFCVPYNECPYANNLVKRYGSFDTIPKNDLNVLIKSKCSRDNEPIRLCCKLSNNYVPQNIQSRAIPAKPDPTLTEDLDYNREFSSQFNSQGLNILAELSCGRSAGDRLAGGNEVDLAEFPWMALLTYNEGSDQINCGGSLISNRYVLTATHCVNQAAYQVIGVRLGEHDLSTNPDCRRKGRKNVCSPVVEDFGIEKIIPHPRYNEKMRINDIALIKLERVVDFKRHIKPVCLPITKPSYETTTNNFIIAGWGVTENSTRSLVLLKAEVLAQSRSVCQYFYSPLSVKINEKHICAGNRQTGRDTCKGDSGGPLVAFNTYSNVKHFIQYGIVASGGTACNLQQGFPGVYTNVLTYLPWITHNIID